MQPSKSVWSHFFRRKQFGKDTPSMNLLVDFGVWFPRWILWWICLWILQAIFLGKTSRGNTNQQKKTRLSREPIDQNPLRDISGLDNFGKANCEPHSWLDTDLQPSAEGLWAPHKDHAYAIIDKVGASAKHIFVLKDDLITHINQQRLMNTTRQWQEQICTLLTLKTTHPKLTHIINKGSYFTLLVCANSSQSIFWDKKIVNNLARLRFFLP